MIAPRSLLFLPATRADRFPKALASGADAVCLDLEDALALADKERGLATVLDLLGGRSRGGPLVAVRVNDVTGGRGLDELRALSDPGLALDVVVIPKVGVPDSLTHAAAVLEARGRRARFIVMVETAAGLARVEEIARASDRVSILMLGGMDLTAELGAALEWDALLYARSRLVHAAALAGLATLDTPSPEVADLEELEREARAVARLGFTGKAAIHPAQLNAIHAAFRPSEDEVERARRVVRAFEESKGGVVLVDGRMVDPPVVKAALRTVARGEGAQ